MAKKKGDEQKDTTEEKEITKQERKEERDFGGLPDRDLKKNLGCG